MIWLLTILCVLPLAGQIGPANENPFRSEPQAETVGDAASQPLETEPPKTEPLETEPLETLPAGTIEVTLTDGRTLRAELDRRTTADALWLCWSRENMSLARPFDWPEVERAMVGGEALSGVEFRQLVERVRQEIPLPPPTEHFVYIGIPTPAPPVLRAPILPRVRSIAVEATVGNWDSDVEVDGLMVRVYPLDECGRIVPVSGTVSVELLAERSGVVRPPRPFASVAQWTRLVRLDEIGPTGVVLKLPFQAVHPEFADSLLPHGLVHVRLSVPGQGTFEASDAMVRIRPYSAVRDRLELSTGRRFFPGETTRGER